MCYFFMFLHNQLVTYSTLLFAILIVLVSSLNSLKHLIKFNAISNYIGYPIKNFKLSYLNLNYLVEAISSLNSNGLLYLNFL